MEVLLLRLLATLLHAAMMFALAPLLTGLVALLKARLLARQGPNLMQPYRDLSKLLRKQTLAPATATGCYAAWPYAGLAATAGAAWLVPGFARGMLGDGAGDLITIAGLLALAGAAAVLAGLETGFGFGGAGAARATLAGMFIQAVFLAVILAFGIGGPSPVSSLLALLALAAVALVATGRLPVNEAASGAETAMAQTAMALEYGGPHLALLSYTRMLRLMVWFCIISTLGLPFGLAEAGAILSWPGGLAVWVLKLAVLAALLALFESRGAARLALPVPALLGVAMLLAVLAAIFALAPGGA